MASRDNRIKENMELIDMLPDEINDVDFKIGGEVVKANLKKRVFKTKEEKKTTGCVIVIEISEFPNGTMGMMLPAMGKAGYVPSEQELKNLVAGKEIKASGLISNKGSDYDATLAFDPKEERTSKGVTYYGNIGPVGWN